ncbi:MAG: aminotransferase class I/II-fold pyridoxal phosphate-dependent enzyme [Candidatus Aenigmarchaeota archaeon]|nr:aminotransferase class I/II-fold pyridoxal phosphate-dependent enzyme [Candidatus Aenigmarchaeota archaeon]
MHISERETGLPDTIMGQLIKIAAEDKSVISLGAGEPDFPAPPKIVAYTKKIAGDCSHYSPPEGRMELREAITRKARKENRILCSPDDVIVTSGSQEALLLASAAVLDVSEQVIIPDPSFLGYVPMLEMLNIFPVYSQSNEDFELDPDAMAKKITSKTEAILINTPSNPTGGVYSRKTLEEIAEIAIQHDLYVFSDEAYEKIVYEGKHVSIGSLNGMQEHVATFQTFSKSFAMCGYRLGYVIAPPEMTQAMKKLHIYSTISAPTISQILGVKALTETAYANKMVKEYDRRRKMIVHRLNSMGLPTKMPKGAFYTFSDITSFSASSRQFSLDLLKKKKLAVVPGIEFGPGGEGYIRCSYATAYQKIEKAMDRLEEFLKNDFSL